MGKQNKNNIISSGNFGDTAKDTTKTETSSIGYRLAKVAARVALLASRQSVEQADITTIEGEVTANENVLFSSLGDDFIIVDDTFAGTSNYITASLQTAFEMAQSYYLANTKILPIYVCKLSDVTQAIAITTTAEALKFYVGILDHNFLLSATTYGISKIEIDATLLENLLTLEMVNLVTDEEMFVIKNGIKIIHASFKNLNFTFKGIKISKGTSDYGFEIVGPTQINLFMRKSSLEDYYSEPGTSQMISGEISEDSTIRGTIFQFDNAMLTIRDSTLRVDKMSCERADPYLAIINLIKGGIDEFEGTGTEFIVPWDGVSKLVMYRDGLVTLDNAVLTDLHSSMLTTKATVSAHELLQVLPASGLYTGHTVILTTTGMCYVWDGSKWVNTTPINITAVGVGVAAPEGDYDGQLGLFTGALRQWVTNDWIAL